MEWRTLETLETQPGANHRYRLIERWSNKPNRTYWEVHHGLRGAWDDETKAYTWMWEEIGDRDDRHSAEEMCEAHFSCFTIVMG